MNSTGMWLAAAPIAGALILLTPLPGQWRLRRRIPWVGAVALLLVTSTFFSQCSARAVATDEVAQRLFGGPTGVVSIFDSQDGRWIQIAAAPGAQPPAEVAVLSAPVRAKQAGRATTGAASPTDTRAVRVQVKGTPADVAKLNEALQLLASSRYGSAVVGDVLQRDDVTIEMTDQIGISLPMGGLLTTGGTAVTEGKTIYISRRQYGNSSVEVLAAMAAHELTHVAQNISAGTAWWEWPWTTIDREMTAHEVQAIVWAELRGNQRDWEQDLNLHNAQNPDTLRNEIMGNPAYPSWLAPDIAC